MLFLSAPSETGGRGCESVCSGLPAALASARPPSGKPCPRDGRRRTDGAVTWQAGVGPGTDASR